MKIEDLSVDQIILLSEICDKFLCSDLLKKIQEVLYQKFSIVYALKIYMWTLKYFP